MNTVRYSLAEHVQPYKVTPLAVGIGLLLLGSHLTPAPDWDYVRRFLVAIPTYFFAAPSLRTLLERNWRPMPLASGSAWLCIDGIPAANWSVVDSAALAAMRAGHWPRSFALFLACGLFWPQRCNLGE